MPRRDGLTELLAFLSILDRRRHRDGMERVRCGCLLWHPKAPGERSQAKGCKDRKGVDASWADVAKAGTAIVSPSKSKSCTHAGALEQLAHSRGDIAVCALYGRAYLFVDISYFRKTPSDGE